ncbi:MAG: AI-2E family transporter [Acidobacteria bacterium]|nr:AI-2E family transporter [Acidobacteriota bacterium]MCG3192740.1 putative transport protein YhhT [Thermoanaerobaculia bacterium]MCK6682289.1 AI-2E family transporter [Thermoanaerobaculia bacterium]
MTKSGVFASGTFSTGNYPAPGGVFRSRALVVIGTAAAVGLLWYGKVLFVTFFFALFLSFAIHPFVELLERIKLPRFLAILIVLLLLFALMVFFVANALQQAQAFAENWPEYSRRLQSYTQLAQGFFAKFEEQTRRLLPEADRSVRAVKLEERAIDSLSRVVLQLRTVFSLFLYAAAVPMLVFFMLKDREKYAGAITRILRIKGGRAASDFAEGVARVLSGYVLGELFVVLITACVTTAGLLVLKVPYSYVLGPMAGLCVLVPYVGVIFSTTPALLIAIVTTQDASLAIKVLVFYSVVQFIEGNVLTPFIVGSRVKLHPLAVMVAFLFWGILWGVPGAILAVPLTATVKVVSERFERFAPWAALLGERTPDPVTEEPAPDKEPQNS